jgi:hypothetical protein
MYACDNPDKLCIVYHCSNGTNVIILSKINSDYCSTVLAWHTRSKFQIILLLSCFYFVQIITITHPLPSSFFFRNFVCDFIMFKRWCSIRCYCSLMFMFFVYCLFKVTIDTLLQANMERSMSTKMIKSHKKKFCHNFGTVSTVHFHPLFTFRFIHMH